MKKLIWSNDTNSFLQEVPFSEIKPGQIFNRGNYSYVRVNGWVITCIPDEEYGDEYSNVISLKNGDCESFEDDDICHISPVIISNNK